MDPKIGYLRAATMCALLGTITGIAHADGFDVTPVTVRTNGEVASIKVSNSGDARIYIETSIYDWSKDSMGQDVLAESDLAVASPPAMWIPPRASYIVRVRLPKATGSRERTFRVMLEQVPDRAALIAGHVLMMIRQNLAAFSEPDQLAPPELHASREGDSVYVENTGGRHARIAGLSQDGKTLADTLLGYALAGGRLRIKIPVHPGRIELKTDVGIIALDVP